VAKTSSLNCCTAGQLHNFSTWKTSVCPSIIQKTIHLDQKKKYITAPHRSHTPDLAPPSKKKNKVLQDTPQGFGPVGACQTASKTQVPASLPSNRTTHNNDMPCHFFLIFFLHWFPFFWFSFFFLVSFFDCILSVLLLFYLGNSFIFASFLAPHRSLNIILPYTH
jgi:hypothetical protein